MKRFASRFLIKAVALCLVMLTLSTTSAKCDSQVNHLSSINLSGTDIQEIDDIIRAFSPYDYTVLSSFTDKDLGYIDEEPFESFAYLTMNQREKNILVLLLKADGQWFIETLSEVLLYQDGRIPELWTDDPDSLLIKYNNSEFNTTEQFFFNRSDMNHQWYLSQYGRYAAKDDEVIFEVEVKRPDNDFQGELIVRPLLTVQFSKMPWSNDDVELFNSQENLAV